MGRNAGAHYSMWQDSDEELDNINNIVAITSNAGLVRGYFLERKKVELEALMGVLDPEFVRSKRLKDQLVQHLIELMAMQSIPKISDDEMSDMCDKWNVPNVDGRKKATLKLSLILLKAIIEVNYGIAIME